MDVRVGLVVLLVVAGTLGCDARNHHLSGIAGNISDRLYCRLSGQFSILYFFLNLYSWLIIQSVCPDFRHIGSVFSVILICLSIGDSISCYCYGFLVY